MGRQAGSEYEPHMHLPRVASLVDSAALSALCAILGRE